MYENLIPPQPLSKNQNNFSVRFAPMPVSEKVMYVESVCASLIDNPFGRRLSPFLIDIRELPELVEAVVCKISDEALVPSYAVLPDSKMARRYANDMIRCKLAHTSLTMAAMRGQTFPASNLGRGSPTICWVALRVRTTCGSRWLNVKGSCPTFLGRRQTPVARFGKYIDL